MSIENGQLLQERFNNVMVVDTSAILYTYSFKCKNKFSMHLEGVKELLRLCATNYSRNTRTILCMDSFVDRAKKPTGYKSNRSYNPMIKAQAKFVEEFFPKLGVDVIRKPGFEADDIIYTIVNKYRKLFNTIIVKTDDKDIYGVVTDYNVTIEGIRNGSPSISVGNYSTAVDSKVDIPYNLVVPHITLFGKASNAVGKLKLSIKDNWKILEELERYMQSTEISMSEGYKSYVFYEYLKYEFENHILNLTESDLVAIIDRIELLYPRMDIDLGLTEDLPSIDISLLFTITKHLDCFNLLKQYGVSSSLANATMLPKVLSALKQLNNEIKNYVISGDAGISSNVVPLGERTSEFVGPEGW